MSISIDNEPAYIIHWRDFQETSLLIDFFTLNYGRLRAVARSGRSKKSNIKAILQPFLPLQIDLKKRTGELFNLTNCSCQMHYSSIDVPNIFCATYINELIYYLYKISEQNTKLFADYISTIESIRNNIDIDIALRNFELNLLDALGYGINFKYLGREYDENLKYIYSIESGFVQSFVDDDAFEGSLLNSIANGDRSEKCSKALKRITNIALNNLLGNKIIHSRIMYNDYLQSLKR